MGLNSRTGIEGPPVSFLNCDRPLHCGLKAPELVMDNRWTASLCTWPPGCSPLVLPPSQEVGSAWACSAWLVVDTQVKSCSRETHSPSRASKTYRHNAVRIIHIHTTINSARAHTTQHHTLWALTVATILADVAVTPPSLNWPKNVSSGTLNLALPNPT